MSLKARGRSGVVISLLVIPLAALLLVPFGVANVVPAGLEVRNVGPEAYLLSKQILECVGVRASKRLCVCVVVVVVGIVVVLNYIT